MMARWLPAAGMLLCGGLTAFGDDVATSAGPGESTVATRDVIYLHASFPVFLRLHIQVDDARFDAEWLKYISSIFRQIDADQDGRITLDETQGKRGLSGEAVSIVRLPNIWMADKAPFDRAITLPEFTPFLIENGRGPFQPPTETPSPPAGNDTGSTLFGLLDVDQDGQLSANEFSSASRAIRRRDLDDDGSFSMNELLPRSRTRLLPQMRTAADATTAAFITLVPGLSQATVLQELIRRYSQAARSGQTASDIGASDLGLDDAQFSEFDVDSSGSLDYDELRRLIKNPPPTLELLIRLGDRDTSLPAIETIRSSGPSLRTSDELVSIVLEDVQIEIGQATSGLDSVRRSLAQQFRNADRDSNNYLDEKEAERHQVFNLSFDEFDIDGDGKVFEEEMRKTIDSKAEIARTRTRMSIRNRGRDLFQILDADRNLQLSHRELAGASERIELWDNDNNGLIDSTEVPQIYQLSLGPGQPVIRGLRLLGQAETVRDGNGGSRGPVWFQKMDRNSDGELARREFPGTRDQFQQLDSDANGVVDTLEAAEAVQGTARQEDELRRDN